MSKASALSKKLNKISAALQKRYGSYVHFEFDDFIEALMHQILALGADTDLAQKMLASIHQEFVDWNDMRMATVREVQDILGEDYPRCREKAEDVINLLADLYTAFRKMNLNEVAPTEEGMQTLRALPETTLVRRDMVEHALYVVFNIPTFSCDEFQFKTLKFLGGLPKDAEMEDALYEITQAIVEEQVELDDIRQLSHGLRCHTDFLMQFEIHDPKPIGYGWDKADPLGMKVPTFKSQIKAVEKIDAIKPAPKPQLTVDGADDDEEIELDDAEGEAPVVKVVGVDDEGNEVELPGNTIEPLQDPEEEKAAEAAPKPEPIEEVPAAATTTVDEPAKAPAPKKEATKKAVAKKSTAKKAATPKKETAKKAAAPKKAAAKKEAAPKKAPAKKSTAKKAVAKKSAAPKKAAAKKEPAKKKAAAKKDSAKKSAVKKSATKKSTSSTKKK